MMAEKGSQGQADKAAAEDTTARKAAETQQERRDQQQPQQQTGANANNPEGSVPDEAKASDDNPVNTYPNYDVMTLDALRSLAEERGVEINRDVEKAHLITELRAADSGTPSAPTRKGAR
jgi:hypothetical protein